MPTNDVNDLLKNPEQIKQIISLLSNLLDAAGVENNNDTSSTTSPKPKRQKQTKSFGKQNKSRGKHIEKENKFLSMPEANMYKEDPDLAKKLYKQPPVARGRKLQIIEARCRVCGKQEKVQASLIYGGIERFKCNKCSATPG